MQQKAGEFDVNLPTRTDGVTTTVTGSGEFDLANAHELRSQLIELIDSGAFQLVLDMTEVSFCDSTALGVLIGVRKRALSHEGSLTLTGVQPQVRRIFELTRLLDTFNIGPE